MKVLVGTGEINYKKKKGRKYSLFWLHSMDPYFITEGARLCHGYDDGASDPAVTTIFNSDHISSFPW
jgi:hypothetical protein